MATTTAAMRAQTQTMKPCLAPLNRAIRPGDVAAAVVGHEQDHQQRDDAGDPTVWLLTPG